jgi:hypothetical protein
MAIAPRLPRGQQAPRGCSCGMAGEFLIAVPFGPPGERRPFVACRACRDEACGRGKDGEVIGRLWERAGRELEAFAALACEAARVGWPRRFVGDLRHDRDAIDADYLRRPFGWILRPSGTHVALPANPERVRQVAEAFRPEPCRFYLWDGVALRELDQEELAGELERARREAEVALAAREAARDARGPCVACGGECVSGGFDCLRCGSDGREPAPRGP